MSVRTCFSVCRWLELPHPRSHQILLSECVFQHQRPITGSPTVWILLMNWPSHLGVCVAIRIGEFCAIMFNFEACHLIFEYQLAVAPHISRALMNSPQARRALLPQAGNETVRRTTPPRLCCNARRENGGNLSFAEKLDIIIIVTQDELHPGSFRCRSFRHAEIPPGGVLGQ